LISYGIRLNEIDHRIGYPWFAQVFSGLTLAQLKEYVDELFSFNGKVIPNKYWERGFLVDYLPQSPKIFPAQLELINTLHDNGIDVYIITAALEDLTRMVVSDPKYGLNVKPENVIGVSCLLRERETLNVTYARKQIEEGHFWDDTFSKKDHYAMEVTPYILSPDPKYVGKLAVLKEYIHPVKNPILVAGDTLSDHFLLFCSDYSKGGVKLWVNHSENEWKITQEVYRSRADQERELGLEVTGNKNWIMIHPEDLEIKSK